MTQYLDKNVFETEPNWARSPDMEIARGHEVFQYLGAAYAVCDTAQAVMRLRFGFLRGSKAEIAEITDFFNAAQGRLVAFWAPSWLGDLVVTAAFDASAITLTIQDVKYADNWLTNNVAGRHIRILFPDGTAVFRKITAAPSATSITLDSAVGKACAADQLGALLVSLMHHARFDQDEVEVNYITSTVAEIELTMATCDDWMFTTTTTTTTTTSTTTT